MNLPNKLTVLRILLVPVLIICMLARFPYHNWVALAVFVIASLTDLADGKIARKYGMVTDFGKFMDPLADKLLVTSALICLVGLGKIASWIVIVIVAREFTISGFRLIAANNNIVIAANYWGKFKTTFQMIAIILLIMDIPALQVVTTMAVYIALALTIISLATYIYENRQLISQMK